MLVKKDVLVLNGQKLVQGMQVHEQLINHKQHPGEFEGASVAYAGRFNFRFYYEKMLNSETGKCGL